MGEMSGSQPSRGPLLEWGWAESALEAGASGDAQVVAEFPDGVLVAAIDGLGHGPEAARAAREAVRVLQALAGEQVDSLLRACHQELRRTRGAVISVASFDARRSRMTWAGVGNVEGILVRADPNARPAREGIALQGGVVGYQLPSVRPVGLAISPGDVLVLATDGVRGRFVADLPVTGGPQDMADRILASHARGSDDALVVVARYVGGEAA
jgi:negative regulator of sigma-B (phosphoserine phosphatase)